MIVNPCRAVPALFLAVIILVGIRDGVFTPTEASVVAVVLRACWSASAIYGTLQWSMVPVLRPARPCSPRRCCSWWRPRSAFAWVLTIENVPQAIWRGVHLGLGSLALLVR